MIIDRGIDHKGLGVPHIFLSSRHIQTRPMSFSPLSQSPGIGGWDTYGVYKWYQYMLSGTGCSCCTGHKVSYNISDVYICITYVYHVRPSAKSPLGLHQGVLGYLTCQPFSVGRSLISTTRMLRNRQTDDKLGPKQALTLCDIRHRTVLQVKSNPKNHAWQQELAAHQTSVLMILKSTIWTICPHRSFTCMPGALRTKVASLPSRPSLPLFSLFLSRKCDDA